MRRINLLILLRFLYLAKSLYVLKCDKITFDFCNQ